MKQGYYNRKGHCHNFFNCEKIAEHPQTRSYNLDILKYIKYFNKDIEIDLWLRLYGLGIVMEKQSM